MNLGGLQLNYLIALSVAGGADQQVTELGYDAQHVPPNGVGVKYVNLRDEKNSGAFAPYLPPDDISEEYNEPAPDPEGDGFWQNLKRQLRQAGEQGFRIVELDNLDTYDVETALECFDLVRSLGFDVLVKNPAIVDGEDAELLRHPAAVMVVVEEDCGTPAVMEALRKRADRMLPIRFVSYGDGRAWAEEMASAIRGGGYVDMAVTYSALGEYGSCEQILPPSNVEQPPPERPERPPIEPPEPDRPPAPPTQSERPLTKRGDEGQHVVTIQQCLLPLDVDGDFGEKTENAVLDYQRRRHLDVDGEVGEKTWGALEDEFNLPPYPPPTVPFLADHIVEHVCEMAENSAIAAYAWDERGVSPLGCTKGLAVAFAYCCKKLYLRDPAAIEMAKASTGDEDKDALARYGDIFRDLGMPIDEAGVATMRTLFVLMLGLAQRESSGEHCCGTDASAEGGASRPSDEIEAGLFQASWNLSNCSDLIPLLMDQYSNEPPQCALPVFSEDVECSSSDWQSYGSGVGREYQDLAKRCPSFATEMTAIGLRNLCLHWGPVKRFEVEVRPEAENLFKQIQSYLATQLRQHEGAV